MPLIATQKIVRDSCSSDAGNPTPERMTGLGKEARALWSAIADRFAACKLVLHPEKTKIVYSRM